MHGPRRDVTGGAVPERILIIRLSAIGDLVMASPLAWAFRRTYPHARIDWLAEEGCRDVLDGHPALDAVRVVPRRRFRELWRGRRYLRLAGECLSVARELRRQRYDLAVDAHGLLKSGIWAFLSGAPERIGLGSREGSGVFMTRVVKRTAGPPVIGSQYRKLIREMELAPAVEMTVPVGEADAEFARGIVSGRGLDGGYAVLCPFTTRPQKHWIEERWSGLAGRLRDDLRLRSVLIGGPMDRDAAARILSRASADALVDLTGETTLKQAAAVIAGASLVVGVDTGLMHMGFALGVPTVALFGATRPYLDPRPGRGTVLYHPMDCSPCRRRPTCEGRFPCMKEITVDEVLEAARREATPR